MTEERRLPVSVVVVIPFEGAVVALESSDMSAMATGTAWLLLVSCADSCNAGRSARDVVRDVGSDDARREGSAASTSCVSSSGTVAAVGRVARCERAVDAVEATGLGEEATPACGFSSRMLALQRGQVRCSSSHGSPQSLWNLCLQ